MISKKLKEELAQEDAERDSFDFSETRQTPVINPGNKVAISIRLDPDVIEWFKDQVRGGGSYQSLINKVLRDHIEGNDLNEQIRSTINEQIRSTIREELANLKAS